MKPDRFYRKEKFIAIVSLCVFSVTAISIDIQIRTVTVGGIIALVMLLWMTEKPFILAQIGICYSIIYSGPHTGYLFGRDTHDAARIALSITRNGWPVESIPGVSGFSWTPGIHLLAGLTNKVTGLPIYPSVQPTLLVTYLLPIILSLVILFLVYLIPRQYVSRVGLLFLPAVLWVPYFNFIPTFHRETLALVGVAVAFFALIKHYDAEGRQVRYKILLVVSTMLVVISHHLASVMIVLMILIYISGQLAISKIGTTPSNQVSHPTILAFLMMVLILAWYSFQLPVVKWITGLLLSVLISGEAISSKSSIEFGFLRIFRQNYADWLYQIILATPVVLLLAKERTIDINRYFVLVFGGSIAAIGLIARFTGFIVPDRVMTYYVLFGSWYSLYSIRHLFSESKLLEESVSGVFIACLLVISLLTVPPYIMNDERPSYSDFERNERFSPEVYAVAEFSEKFGTYDTILGDTDVWETVSPSAELTWGGGGYPLILDAGLPAKTAFIFADRNKIIYYYRDIESGASVVRKIPDLADRVSRNQAVYDSGKYKIYVSSKSN